jgi:hypothetical protein
MLIHGGKAAFRQTALQRHLTAFKADFMETASTRFLTFVTATAGFTQARANTATDTASGMLAAFGRFQRIKLCF